MRRRSRRESKGGGHSFAPVLCSGELSFGSRSRVLVFNKTLLGSKFAVSDLFNLESIRSREKDVKFCYSEEEKAFFCRDKKKEKTVAFFFSLKKEEITFIIRAFKEEAIEYSEHKTTRKRRVFCCCCYVYSGREDASAKEADRGERFFVGCDREVRRYLFHTYSSEIECE